MIRIKICGITRASDVQAAVAAGTDALGFVFHPESRRFIEPELAAELIADVPPFVTVVGLFVNTRREEIRRVASLCRLDLIQLHGDESPAACQDLPHRVIKAIRVGQRADLADLERYPVNALLLDAKRDGQYGGTGHPFDWSLLADWRPPRPIILAGGLDPDNVAEAVRRVRPHAVDVSSGVEATGQPGVKDPDKMARFIQAAHQAANDHYLTNQKPLP